MTDQLALLPAPPKPLTERQQFALDTITAHQPIPSDELGAHWCQHNGRHTTATRCDWDGPTGRELGRALRKRGLAIERRSLGGWCLAGYRPVPAGTDSQNATGEGLDEHGFPTDF